MSKSYGQFFNKLSFEIGANRSIFINTSQLFPNQLNEPDGPNDINYKSESPTYTTNYSTSLGFQISKGHYIRLRHSSNSMGSHLDGRYKSSNGFNDTYFILKDHQNIINNISFGGMYELHIPFKKGSVLFGCGFEKHWNNFIDTIVPFSGLQHENYAFHSSIGYLTQIYKIVHLHSKLFMTKSYKIGQVTTLFGGYIGEYVPLQIGLEIGLRVQFESS